MVDLLLGRMRLPPEKGYLEVALVEAVRGHCEYVDTLLSYGADPGYQLSQSEISLISALGTTATWFARSDEKSIGVVFQKLLHKIGPLSAEVMAKFLNNMTILVKNQMRSQDYADQIRRFLEHPRESGLKFHKTPSPIVFCVLCKKPRNPTG